MTDRAAAIVRIATDQGTLLGQEHLRFGRHDDYPLSGEWADEVTAADVYAVVAFGIGEYGPDGLYADECDLAADTFETAYHNVFTGVVVGD